MLLERGCKFKYEKLAIRMPINYINKNSSYFSYDEINRELIISEEIYKIASPLFIKHIEDILEYRLRDKCTKLYKILNNRKLRLERTVYISVDYYNRNATEFFERTINADMSDTYDIFLKHVKPAGKILDAGCGSGRALCFL
jgi:hypothetical protein